MPCETLRKFVGAGSDDLTARSYIASRQFFFFLKCAPLDKKKPFKRVYIYPNLVFRPSQLHVEISKIMKFAVVVS